MQMQKFRPCFVETTNGSSLNLSMVAQMFRTSRGFVVLDNASRVVDWQEHDDYDTQRMMGSYFKAIESSRPKDFLILNGEFAIQLDWFAYLHMSNEGLHVINIKSEPIYLISADEFTNFDELQAELNSVIQKLASGRYARVNWEKYRKSENPTTN